MGELVRFYCPHCWKEIPEEATVCPHCHLSLEGLSNQKFFDKLIDALRHPVPARAAFAAQTLGRLGDARAVEPLLETLGRTDDPEVQEAVIQSLGTLGDARAVSALAAIMEDAHRFLTLRLAAAEALGNIGGEQAIAVLKRTASRGNSSVARAGQAALIALKDNGTLHES